MALTQQQKIAIAHAYAPILYFHSEEEFVPTGRSSILVRRRSGREALPRT